MSDIIPITLSFTTSLVSHGTCVPGLMVGCSALMGGQETLSMGVEAGIGVDQTVIMANRAELRVVPAVSIAIRIEDIEETIDREAEEAQAKMAKLVSQAPVNQYPAWVQRHKVNIIRNLACHEQVREMLIHGAPAIEVARLIQASGEMKLHKLDTVRQHVEHFKATIPKWQFKMHTPQQSLEAQISQQKQINVVEEMALLIQQQKARISLGIKAETNFGFLQNGMERNMLTQSKLIQDYLEMSQKLGGDDRSKQRSYVPSPDWSTAYDDPNDPVVKQDVAEVMGNPESRTRVTRAVENILELTRRLSPETLARVQKNLVEQPLEPEIVAEYVEGVENGPYPGEEELAGDPGGDIHIEP